MMIKGYTYGPLVAGERLHQRAGFWSNHLLTIEVLGGVRREGRRRRATAIADGGYPGASRVSTGWTRRVK
ncbi:hypothetical protein [Kitasatospora sp. NPDC057015]|uniref:hypothetical protein n=1 Tax=Kitasatospora sp. NPDC057015 TaxID=3346001 RepID=UPI0036412150